VVPPPPKAGPTKKVGALKISHPKARPGPQGTTAIELALVKPLRVSKKIHMLDVAALSQARATGTMTTCAARVPAFDNLGDDSSLDVHEAPSSKTTMEKHASPPPLASSEFCASISEFLPWVLMTSFCRPCPACAFVRFFAGELGRRPGVLSSSRKFCFCLRIFCAIVVVLIDFLFPRRLYCS
jgi:hypothetical protein